MLQRRFIECLVVLILFYLLGFFFIGTDELDISRYYTLGRFQDISIDHLSFIEEKISSNFDFIYFYIFFFFKKYDLSFQHINGIFVSLYFVFFIIYSRLINQKISFFYLLITFLIVPSILIFSISRLVASIVFFNIGIFFLYKKKYSITILFFLLSLFTHTSQLIYLLLVLLSYSFSEKTYKSSKYKVVFFFQLFFILFGLKMVIPLLNKLPFFEKYERYLVYLSPETIGYENFNLITVLYYVLIVLLFIILFYNKKINIFFFRIYYFVFLFLVFSMTFSITILQRNILVLCPVLLVLIIDFFNSRNKNFFLVQFLKLLIFFLIILSLFNLYGYRDGFE